MREMLIFYEIVEINSLEGYPSYLGKYLFSIPSRGCMCLTHENVSITCGHFIFRLGLHHNSLDLIAIVHRSEIVVI